MASYPTKDMQDEFLNAIRKSQETIIESVRTWVDTAQSATPKVPEAQPPLADKLPRPEEVVASAYDFAEKLLANQRQFSEELLKVTTPRRPGDAKSAQQGSAQKGKAAADK